MYEKLGGHGMAFVMVPSLSSDGAFPSQYLGMLNSSNDNQTYNHLFGVEFDTVQDLEFHDINNNHVGININSMISTYSERAFYWEAHENSTENLKVDIDLIGQQYIQGWIMYSGFDQVLNVTISPLGTPRPSTPLLSVKLNLSDVLKDNMYVGFTAATGVISGVHRLLAWSFHSNGEAEALDLSKLPLVYSSSSAVSTREFKIGMAFMSVFVLLAVCGITIFILYRSRQREAIAEWELGVELIRYRYRELEKATCKFSDKQLLGVGGFGRVYKGLLPKSGTELAIKRLSRNSEQGEREFVAEIASTGRIRHCNLVQLLGWSRRKGELLLVYEYMPNRSLDKALHRKSGKYLRWEQRYKIIKGIVAGILYLHEGWEQQILHRDIKSSNVLLDAQMNAKVGDFGLSRLSEHGQKPYTTKVVGTLGYLAPEFARTGKASTSTDVYSFGVLLLEIVTGRRPIEHEVSIEDFLLVETVLKLYSKGRLLDAVDPKLDGFFDVEEVKKVMVIGLLCVQPDPLRRPSMEQVVQGLASSAGLSAHPLECQTSSVEPYIPFPYSAEKR
ncbi:hypothetical protein KP509_05G079100 [Ceratopteris richardii]|nr:hypothetical protein KP509_05G079100 [Ceratopteris richardii]